MLDAQSDLCDRVRCAKIYRAKWKEGYAIAVVGSEDDGNRGNRWKGWFWLFRG